MKNFTRAELMAGAAAIPHGLEVKDAGSLDAETKKLVEELGSTFKTFRQKNDERLDQLAKKGEDAVTKDEVEKINTGLDELKGQIEEIFKKANRGQLGGPGDEDSVAEAKSAKRFGELVGKSDMTVEDFREYKSGLDSFIRKNEVKASIMSVGVDPAGGYLVTPDATGRMVKKLYETTPMRQLATVVPIGSDKLEGSYDNGESAAVWVGETQQRNGTDSGELGTWEIPVHELFAFPTVTQRLLEDARIDVEGWLADKGVTKFARAENAAFINGNGAKKPRGLLTYDMVADDDKARAWGKFQFMVSGSAAAVDKSDALINLIFELQAAYRQNANWLMARRTQRDVRKLKDGQNNYLSGIRLADGVVTESLLGFNTVEGEDMPAIAAGSFPIAFGDFAETYTIVDRLGFSVIRDNLTRPGFVKFQMRKRVGGGAVNFESMKFLKTSA